MSGSARHPKYQSPPSSAGLDNFHPGNEVYFSSEPNYEFGPYRTGLSIKYCQSGIEKYTIDGRETVLHEGEYMVIAHDCEVYYQSTKAHQGVSIFLENKAGQSPYLVTNTSFSAIDEFGTWLSDILSQSTPFGRLGFFQSCSTILDSSHMNLNKRIDSILRAKRLTRVELARRILLGARYMHGNAMGYFDLEKVANAAVMSKHHFIRYFKQYFGVTPWHYFQNIRMELAMESIVTGQCRLHSLSENLGFSQLSAFSRAFKDHFGRPPSYYLKKSTRERPFNLG